MKEQTVVVRQLQSTIDMKKDYVSLPQNYGTQEYFKREDVQAIRGLVFEILDRLEEKTGFTEKLTGSRNVILKPNLVSVYHKSGMKDIEYPESTDPRVLDSVIEWVQRYNSAIIIAESSGKPMPTRTSFRISGIDRIAKYRKIKLVELETQRVYRYLLPKARVMKEVLLPEAFVGVAEGEDFYISVPKLKTNLYTQITLGFKNSMGIIPYSLRERNHNYRINDKLADFLYLIKPDLTIIDGIIGGEGNTPAPVDPVDSRVLLAGLDPVAVDRAGTRVMGFDPDDIPLFQAVAQRGFFRGEPEIDGTLPVFHFRPADDSLLGENFCRHFPNILTLVGHTLPQAPKIKDLSEVTPQVARELESACRGGCLAAIRSGFEYVVYAPKKNKLKAIAVIIGSGVEIGEEKWWFDREGKPYSEKDIRALSLPVLTVGNCADGLKGIATWRTPGCCSPSVCMLASVKAMGIPFPLLSVKNHYLLKFGTDVLRMVMIRSLKSAKGIWIDCPSVHEDKIYEVPELEEEGKNIEKDFISLPLPAMTWKDKKKMISDQLSMLRL